MSRALTNLGIAHDFNLTVECAFATAPLATPTWIDISQYVRAFTTTRGRSSDRDTVQAGTATVVLDNTDRRFTPENQGSPYSPFVVPRKRLRIRVEYGGTLSASIFDGYVDGWPMRWPDKGNVDSVVEVEATDAFKLLSSGEVTAAEVQELSGTRVSNLLDDFGWPSGAAWRALDSGTFEMVARTVVCVNPTAELRLVSDSESGLFFIGADGRAVFHDQDHRGAQTVAATFTDDGTGLPYTAGSGLVFVMDDDQIWNRVQATRIGGAASVAAEDATSIAKYGKSLLTLNDLLVVSDTALTTIVQTYRNRYGDPAMRAKKLSFSLEQFTADSDYGVLALELESLVTVKRNAPGAGTPQVISQNVHIESITHTVTASPPRWDVTMELSPQFH